MNKKSPIALFDSGVGGLTIAKEVIAEFPQEEIIYFGDNAHLPYGPRSQSEIRDFVLKIIDYFTKLDVKLVIIACNTATVAGLKEARKEFNIPIIGPIEPGVQEAITETDNNRIGVIATEGTIASGAYQNALQELAPEVEVYAQACPEFVLLVEGGELYSDKVKKVAKECLKPLKKKQIDTLLLGCTHFPYLSEIIQEVMGQDVNLIYPGRGIALKVREILTDYKLLNEEQTEVDNQFYVSDLNRLSNKFVNLGKVFLDFTRLDFKELDLWNKDN